MKNYDHEWAKGELKKLNPDQKFDTMIKTVAIITKLLESEQLKPIIVGGFSVEIYTDEAYSTPIKSNLRPCSQNPPVYNP